MQCDMATDVCAGCQTDVQCANPKPVCGADSACAACTSDAQCATSPAGRACETRRPLQGSCVQCVFDSDCTSPQSPHGDAVAHTCGPCSGSACNPIGVDAGADAGGTAGPDAGTPPRHDIREILKGAKCSIDCYQREYKWQELYRRLAEQAWSPSRLDRELGTAPA